MNCNDCFGWIEKYFSWVEKYFEWLGSWNWDVDIFVIFKGIIGLFLALLGILLTILGIELYILSLLGIFIIPFVNFFNWIQGLTKTTYRIGFTITIVTLFFFHTSNWIRNVYNQGWAALLTISFILTYIGLFYMLKTKDGMFDKICRITTITSLSSIIFAFPMSVLGFIICLILTGNENPRLVEPLCYGWGVSSVVLCLSQLLKVIYFMVIQIFKVIKTPILYKKGDKLYKNGQYKEALKYYEKAFLIDKNYSRHDFTVGMIYYQLKDYDNAICHLEMAFDFKKRDEICTALIEIYEETNNDSKVFEWYDKLLSMHNQNSNEYKKYSQQKEEYIKLVEEKQARMKQTILETEIQNLYKKFEDAFSTKQYQTAVKLAKELTELAPENSEYKDKLAEVQKLYDNEKEHIEQLYQQSISSEKENDYQKAFDLMSEAKTTASDLGDDVGKYDAQLQEYNKKMKLIEAEDLYISAKEYFEDKNYSSALHEIKKAIKLVPNNNTYIDLKNTIDFEIKKNENEAKFQKLYEQAAEYYLDGDLNNASNAINQALYLKPNNEIAKELSEKINSGKIDIMTCTKKALLTLDFINDKQAENIIQARDEGVMWYDYQKFSEQFGIMPHQWVDVEEKIDFPLKQANKYGRKLDI